MSRNQAPALDSFDLPREVRQPPLREVKKGKYVDFGEIGVEMGEIQAGIRKGIGFDLGLHTDSIGSGDS